MISEAPAYRHRVWMRTSARLAALVWRWGEDRAGLRPFLGRLTSHVALLATLAFLLLVGTLRVESFRSAYQSVEAAMRENIAQDVSAASRASAAEAQAYLRPASRGQITRQVNSHTTIPERPRLEIVTYVVQPGDTTEKIAASFGLQPTTLSWSNPELEKTPDLLRVGQVLTILPIDGVYHTIQLTDTLETIAQTYKVEVSAIVECPFNTLPASGTLVPGEKLIVPGGTKPYEVRKVTTYAGPVPSNVEGSGSFLRPCSGVLTQGYWYAHRAIDIGSATGTAIVAADGGYVSFAGWTDIGYGYLIVVDHGNGFETYYAHLSGIYVVEGQPVSAGEVIGAMGTTGNSTGPHLHFEIRYNGYLVNPLIFLR